MKGKGIKIKREDQSKNNSSDDLNCNSQNNSTANKKSKLEQKIEHKKQQYLDLESIDKDIKEHIKNSGTFESYIEHIVKTENKFAIDLIAKKHEYFTDHINIENKELLDLIVKNVCIHGKLDILKNLADTQKIDFEEYSKSFYENNKQDDLLTIAANNEHCEMIKYLLENNSLFIVDYDDRSNPLIDKDELYDADESLKIFEVSFVESILKSKYNQEMKLKITNILLEFINTSSYSDKQKEGIVNNILDPAICNGADKVTDKLINYIKDNGLTFCVLGKGLFCDDNKICEGMLDFVSGTKTENIIRTVEVVNNVNNVTILSQQKDSTKALEMAKVMLEYKKDVINHLVNICTDLLNQNNNLINMQVHEATDLSGSGTILDNAG